MAKYPAAIYRAACGPKQRLRHPVTDSLIGCTDWSLALAIRDITCDSVNVGELDIRRLSDEWPVAPGNKSPGLNQAQLVKVADKLHFRYAKCNGLGWDELVTAIRQNRRIVAQLWYASIGGGNIGHAVLLEALRLRSGTWQFLFVDPMTAKRAWISASKVRDAMSDLAEIEGMERDQLFWGKTAPGVFVAMGAR